MKIGIEQPESFFFFVVVVVSHGPPEAHNCCGHNPIHKFGSPYTLLMGPHLVSCFLVLFMSTSFGQCYVVAGALACKEVYVKVNCCSTTPEYYQHSQH